MTQMRVVIHDVGHGSCISLAHSNGRVLLWDCGHSDSHRPSIFLPESSITQIHGLYITNYDEDHISYLPSLRNSTQIVTLTCNRSISTQELRRLKLESGPITSAMQSLLEMIDRYSTPPQLPFPGLPDVQCTHFMNEYENDFVDTNNISLVTFLTCNGLKFIIPGDLESDGWERLLERDNFCRELESVNIFIASHHGRKNGYCSDVFNYCNPDVVVFSDSSIQYATQEMSSTYSNQATGVKFRGKHRSVLSTRKDGSIIVDIDDAGHWNIT